MTTRFIANFWQDWLWPGTSNNSQLLHADASDRILICPSDLGRGYIQEIPLREDLALVILDYTLKQHLFLHVPGESNLLEFEFQLAGPNAGSSFLVPYLGLKDTLVKRGWKRFFKIEILFKRPSLIPYCVAFMEHLPPQTYKVAEKIVQFMHSRSTALSPSPSAEIWKKVLQGEIFLDPDVTFEQAVPPTLYSESIAIGYAQRHPITSAMEQIVERILSCPYQGATRRAYLKRQALKLVALRLEAAVQPHLQEDNLNYIYQAASILRNRLANPPTVESLARQVFTNRLKLNQGFHLVYGTTPFGYLRDCRLMQARRLLVTSELSIEQVAARIGYTSRSRFAAAFRNKIGLNPKVFQMQAWKNSTQSSLQNASWAQNL